MYTLSERLLIKFSFIIKCYCAILNTTLNIFDKISERRKKNCENKRKTNMKRSTIKTKHKKNIYF